MNLANVALRVLFAPQCSACESPLSHPLSGPVCGVCWQSIAMMTPPCCPICGDAMASAALPSCARCSVERPEFARARSAGRYDGSLRAIVHALKYQRCRALAGRLGGMMREAGLEILSEADAVVPVPLHPWRRLRRGFNQADDLARCLGKPVARVLKRRHHGPPQARLPSGRREGNVRGAFAVRLGARRRVEGRILVIVDDVMTTGATLNACSRVLLEAGARSVYALTAARAVAGPTAQRLLPPDLSTTRRR